jgi:hypothetical protein
MTFKNTTKIAVLAFMATLNIQASEHNHNEMAYHHIVKAREALESFSDILEKGERTPTKLLDIKQKTLCCIQTIKRKMADFSLRQSIGLELHIVIESDILFDSMFCGEPEDWDLAQLRKCINESIKFAQDYEDFALRYNLKK